MTTEIERRRAVEQLIWRIRAAAAVFMAVQTAVSPGDNLRLSWLLAVLMVGSVVVTAPILRDDSSTSMVRWVGVTAMAIDAFVVAAVLVNNLTDPAEPMYIITTLVVVEASLRWSLWGGALSGLLSGAASAVWTWVVYDRVGEPFDASYATLRLGIIAVLGLFVGSIVEQLNRERRALQRTMDVSLDLIVVLRSDGTIITVNGASRDVLGYSPEEMIGEHYRQFLHPDTPEPQNTPEFERLVDRGKPILAEREFVRADGESRWLELNITPVTDESVLYAVARDVTERREAAHRLAVSEQRYRSLFDHSADAVYSLDTNGRFTSANPTAESLSGYSQDELTERNYLDLIPADDRERTTARFRATLAGRAQTYETSIRTKGGSVAHLHVTNVPIVVDDEVVGAYGVAKDVTERRTLERELNRQARHDQLTGLLNRFALDEMLDRLIADRRTGGLGLLFIDLDRFKVVNDSLGHHRGDELLRLVVERLEGCLREADVLVRWAGDEFCAVLPGVRDVETASAIAHRMLDALEVPYTIAGRPVALSASIGITLALEPTDGSSLVRQADQAMYAAKRAGRGRVSVWSPEARGSGRDRLDLEVQLRAAVHDGHLTLVHQPVIEVGSGRLAGFESLSRWEHPDGSLVLPEEFIPLAEETGLIRPLTRWAIREACLQQAAWDRLPRPDGAPLLPIGVNISTADLHDRSIIDDVQAALDESGLAPGRLVLEVTESMLVGHPEGVAATLRGLREIGVMLALDDFGTGYSSLDRLQYMPVTILKLDRSFVQRLTPGSGESVVVRSLIDIGAAFDLVVIAEGVERPEQLETLAEIGCPYAQGYLFGQPAPAEHWNDLVRRRRHPLDSGATVPTA